MKTLMAVLGFIFIIIGVGILMYAVISEINNNTILIISGILVVIGVILHVILNKKLT